jgi:anti-sigma B factor antagonist
MHLKVTHGAGVSIVHLEGDFLLEPQQNKLREKIHELVDKGSNNIIIDLTSVKHINSCGLGSLVCAYTTIRRIGGSLRLAGISTAVGELLSMTQLVKIFDISPTLDQALENQRSQ